MASEISEFLRVNGLRQIDLVKYLGLSKPYISQVVNGTAKLSIDKLSKLINNDRGWDASMLAPLQQVNQIIGDGSSNNTQVVGMPEIALMKERIQYLEKILDEKERTIQILLKQVGKQ